jgi:hypothetical protein
MKPRQLLGTIEKTVYNNTPEILTAIGVSGVVTTGYLAAVAGAQASDMISLEQGMTERFLTRKEKLKLTWKCYIPAVASGIATIACVVGSHRVSTRRAAAAYSLMAVTDQAFKDYREKVVETIGEKKAEAIQDEIVKDRLAKNPPSNEVVIVGSGTVLCCEMYTGRYFNSDMETLRRAENEINSKTLQEMYTTLSDFYSLVGLPYTAMSDDFGWTTDRLLKLRYTTVLSDDGRPCIAFEYDHIKPRDRF